eukprot:1218137-Pyramimonas_sp.AAC.1
MSASASSSISSPQPSPILRERAHALFPPQAPLPQGLPSPGSSMTATFDAPRHNKTVVPCRPP